MKGYKRYKLSRHDREQTFNPAFVPELTPRMKHRHKPKRAVRGVMTRLRSKPLRGWDIGSCDRKGK